MYIIIYNTKKIDLHIMDKVITRFNIKVILPMIVFIIIFFSILFEENILIIDTQIH